MVANVTIQSITPTEAHGVACFAVYTPVGPDHWGRYRDTYVPEDGRWVIKHRRARVDTAIPGGWFDRTQQAQAATAAAAKADGR